MSVVATKHWHRLEEPIVLVVDDTLFKRRGKKVDGAAWQYGNTTVRCLRARAASRGMATTSW